ncbi:MAG TPA: hypothetical protein VHL10_05300 [Nitrososphaera sp.]|nr:hypothetical protein [Nitrososphaera sp.]
MKNWKMLEASGNRYITFREVNRKNRKLAARDSAKAKAWRFQCLKRDHYQCVLCGSRKLIQVHHLKRWIDDVWLRFKKWNGATLCKVCHDKGHDGQGLQFTRSMTLAILEKIYPTGMDPEQKRLLLETYQPSRREITRPKHMLLKKMTQERIDAQLDQQSPFPF